MYNFNQHKIRFFSGRLFSVSMIICFVFLIFPTVIAQELTMMEKIQARITGPFHFRLILQPLIAIIIGVVDGTRDAKTGRPTFLFHLITSKEGRKSYLKEGWNSIAKPLSLGVILDIIVQFILFKSIRIWGALLLGALIIALPYAISRGLSNLFKRQSASDTK